VCDHEGNSLSTDLHTPDLAQLVLGLLRRDAVDGETTLGIIQQTEVLVGLLNVDNVHETGRVVGVSPDLVIHFDEPLHQDEGNLPLGKSVLQAIAQEDDQGQAFAELVGTGSVILVLMTLCT